VIGNDGEESVEFKRQIVPKMWCAAGYGSVGEPEKSSE